MATPPIVPAGWYTDPVGRHEYRYWDGTDWKPEVSDGGVAAVDPLGPAPPPLPQRTIEPAVVATSRPPVSAARLDGRWTVGVKIVQGASDLRGIPKSHSWDESWRFSPRCATGPCAVRLVGHFGRLRFKTTLARAGAVYRGKTVGNVFPCGSGSNSFPIRSTLRIRIRVKTAQVAGRVWSAGSWSGTMGIAAPYTSSGAFYCPASHQAASLAASS
jgi:hypothetical protein